MKSIILTQTQIKAYGSGATMFLFPINMTLAQKATFDMMPKDVEYILHLMKDAHINMPIQKVDNDIFVQEKFVKCKQCECIMYDFNYYVDANCPGCEEDFITEKSF